jgi:hypothetical protein
LTPILEDLHADRDEWCRKKGRFILGQYRRTHGLEAGNQVVQTSQYQNSSPNQSGEKSTNN